MSVVKELGGIKYTVASDEMRSTLSRWPDCAAAAARGAGVIAPWWRSVLSGPLLVTNDFRDVRQLASADNPGFVVVEPAQGWEHIDEPVDGAPLPPTRADKVSPWTMLGAAAGLGVVAWLLWSQ